MNLVRHCVVTIRRLPHQTGINGCVTAAAAFIVGELTGRQLTAAAFDRILGREPKKPADSSAFGAWLLRNGFKTEIVRPPHALDAPSEALVSGDMSLDAFYTDHYSPFFGGIAQEEADFYKKYLTDIFIPSKLASAERNAPYLENGQMILRAGSADIQVLHRLLQTNTYLYCEIPTTEGARMHAVSIFRPDQNLPALVFSPGYLRPQTGQKPSDVTAFNSVKYMDVFRKTELVSAISVWDESRVSAIELTH